MEVDEALDKWIDGELSTKEVFMATGFGRYSDIYREIVFEKRDLENELEFDMAKEIQDMDQAELEAEAWVRWDSWLKEEPDYLEACVRMLKARTPAPASRDRPPHVRYGGLNDNQLKA